MLIFWGVPSRERSYIFKIAICGAMLSSQENIFSRKNTSWTNFTFQLLWCRNLLHRLLVETKLPKTVGKSTPGTTTLADRKFHFGDEIYQQTLQWIKDGNCIAIGNWTFEIGNHHSPMILSLLLISIAAFALFVPNAPQKLGSFFQEIPGRLQCGGF